MALILIIVVGFTAFVMAAAPRLYNQTLDEELQFRVSEAPAEWRNISVTKQQRSSIGEYSTILERLEANSQSYYDELPISLQQIINSFSSFTETQKSPVLQTRLQPRLDINRSLQFRFQGHLDEQITLIDGRWPRLKEPVLFSELMAVPGARGETPTPLYEIAVSEASLTDLAYEREQFLTVRLNGGGQRVYIRIVGVFAINDPAADFWNDDTRLEEPVIAGFATDFGEVIEAVVLPPVESYVDMLGRADSRIPWYNEWIFHVDPEQITLENYPEVSAEIRNLKISLGPIDRLQSPDDQPAVASTGILPQITFPEIDAQEPALNNELPLVLERFAGQARLTSSIIALVTIGLLGVSLAALGLLAALIADRRRGMVTLLRGRGASKTQLFSARIVEGLLLCMPPALAGLLVASIAIDSRPAPWSVRAAIITGLLAVGLVLVAAGGNILPRLGTLLSERSRVPGGLSIRRLLAEILVLLLALAGIFLLRQRGLEPDADGEGLGGFDPFLTAVPVLLALTAGVILLRLFPYLMRSLAWLAHWLRGTVLFVGLRRMAYQSTAANLALLVLLLAVGVSVFASIVAFSVDQARINLTWTEVRADYRISMQRGASPALPDIDLSDTPGVEAQAREFRTAEVTLSAEGFQGSSNAIQSAIRNAPAFTLIAIEVNPYQQITDGTAIAYSFPNALQAPPLLEGLGTIENPVPVLIPSVWPTTAGDRPPTGTILHLKVSSAQYSGAPSVFVEIAGTRPSYPGVNGAIPFIVMRYDAFGAAVAPQLPSPIRPTTIYIGGADLQQPVLEAALAEQVRTEVLASIGRDAPLGIVVTSRNELLETLRDAPLARGLTDSFRFSFILAAIYGGLVVIVALVLTAHDRSRDLGYLRTLGLNSRQVLGVTVIETVPGVLIACALGVPLGILIARLTEPGLDLRAFVGPEVPITIAIDQSIAIVVATSLAAISLVSAGIFAIFTRRRQLGNILRIGE